MILMLVHAIINYKKWLDERKDIEYLYSLSERELRDMGITRYEIKHKVKNGRR